MPASQIIYLGHASFKVITSNDKIVLIDPWLAENPSCPAEHKVQSAVDLILITHGHADHFDANLPALIERTSATVIAHPQVRYYLGAKEITTIEPMNTGGTITVHGLKVTMTPAFHSANISQAEGITGYTHEAVGYVLHTEDNLRIYFAGDTALFGDMRLIGELYRPQLAVLPIGDRFTMGPFEAAHALRLLGVRHVIPMHYGTFPELTGTPEALRTFSSNIHPLTIHALQPGEVLDGDVILSNGEG